MKFFIEKKEKLPPKVTPVNLLRSFIGGTLGILILLAMTKYTEMDFIMAPFGATCVLLFAASNSPLAQPRNVIFGHLIAAFIGVAFLKLFGHSPYLAAPAMGLSIAVMQALKCVHAPAGANPVVIILAAPQMHVGWDFLIFPVLVGSLLLVGVAFIVNNIHNDKGWPEYWFAFLHSRDHRPDKQHKQDED